ncbi:protein translocase subunit secG [Noviherbaspirillum humi]|uniref:Protein-export membrane protein SecG n=1 Tax=Noviherbaspirillum humi TaxID=1688639 RepID=A0A239KSA8_9BURK|nr:preprotein translocase subunit SecG [Noviherbaspirillum humi]SNT21226.1 protein translocase subunit secG [Noviherbaspirillum humi]
MNAMFTIIVIVQVISALAIIGLVLLQHGKGADMGAAFGSGASGSLFGASGSSNFLSKSTAIAAAVFFAATLALAFIGNRPSGSGAGVMDNLKAAPTPAAQTPAAPAKQGDVPAPAPGAGANEPANQIPK